MDKQIGETSSCYLTFIVPTLGHSIPLEKRTRNTERPCEKKKYTCYRERKSFKSKINCEWKLTYISFSPLQSRSPLSMPVESTRF